MTDAVPPGPRLTPRAPETRTAEQAEFALRFTTGRRAASTNAFVLFDAEGRLTGPAAVWELSPGVGGAVEALGQRMRYEVRLTDREREVVVLAVAAHEDSAFERSAHEALGRAVGLSDDELAAVRDGREPSRADERERLVLRTARALLRDGDLDDAAFAAAAGSLGDAVLMELVTLVGYYRLAALQLRVFRVEP